jgi:hypothetical protein
MWGRNSVAGDGLAVAAPVRRALTGDENHPSNRSVRLVLIEEVLIEEGTRGLEASGPLDAGDQTVVVVQNAAERATAFALRAVQEILALELSGRSIGCTLLLLAPRFDPEVMAARLLIARGLITHSASIGSCASELLLRAGCPSPPDLQDSLPSLMDALLGELGSWPLPIRASFHIAPSLGH